MTIESWIAYIVALSLLGLSPGPAWAAVITTGIFDGRYEDISRCEKDAAPESDEQPAPGFRTDPSSRPG